MSGGDIYWSDLEPRFAELSKRLAAIEEQLALVSKLQGVPYAPPMDEVPPTVVALVRAGKTLEAIKEYRQLTGAGIEQARQAIAAI